MIKNTEPLKNYDNQAQASMSKRKAAEESSHTSPNAQKQLPCKQNISLHSPAPAQTSDINRCPPNSSPKQLCFLVSKLTRAAAMDL